MSEVEVEAGGERLVLRWDGAVSLPDYGVLLVTDLHLGKDASFRAAGLPVPTGTDQTTLEVLTSSIVDTGARTLIVLGDLIHDRDSLTTDLISRFASWRKSHAEVDMMLVRGNHDRHVDAFPEQWWIETETCIHLEGLELLHETDDEISGELFQVGGHVHPVVNVGSGADRQRLRCFVVDPHRIIVPAFGPFKGGELIRRRSERFFYCLAGKNVIPVPPVKK